MNTPNDRPDPLDPQELALARILRALPGGEPPPALDARILRAAQDAVASAPTRRRVMWAGGSSGALWGIGSAAAAILAVGIGWRLTVPPDSALPVPRTLPTAVDAEMDDSTPVEFVPMPERQYDDAGPPPPVASAVAPKPQFRPAAPPPPPREPEAAHEEQAFAEAADAAAPAREDSGELDSIVESGARRQSPPASAPAPAPPGGVGRDAREVYSTRQRTEALSQGNQAAKSSDALGSLADQQRARAAAEGQAGAPAPAATAGYGGPGDEEASSRVDGDAKLYPESWIDKIRSRLRSGDTAGARASLRLYIDRYPDHAVPPDLRPLLEE